MNFNNWYKIISTIFLHNFNVDALPFKYFLVVTKSCGSRCTNCLIWQEKVESELTVEEFRRLAVNSKDNLVWLNLSGGEPTDRNDLIDIIQVFQDNCPHLKIINFTTNALNYESLKSVTEYLANSKDLIIGINVSIDGPPAIHDRIRGTKDGFNKAIAALKMLRSFPHIQSSAALTIFPTNQDHIEETLLAIQNEIPDFTLKDFHINFPHTSDHYYGNNKINYTSRIQLEKVKPFFKIQSQNLSSFDYVEVIYQNLLEKYLQEKKTPLICAAIKSNIYISEKGEVFPCTIWDKSLGSLRESSFDLQKILKKETSIETRYLIIEKKCPNCWTPCEAFPTILTNLKETLVKI